MGILDNLENAWEDHDHTSLASKIFSETVCEECLEQVGIEK